MKEGIKMDAKKIGEVIRNHRQEKKLTQEELANILYVSNKTISKWETGRGLPSIDLLKPLSRTIDIELNELLGETKDTPYEEIILKELKRTKQKNKVKLITSIIICLILCLLETIIYIAKRNIDN